MQHMQLRSDDKVNRLLREFADLSYGDAKDFITGLNHSAKIGELLASYASLDEDDAKKFVVSVNDFMFASAMRKQSMRLVWKRGNDETINNLL
ncbi:MULTISPECIES: hypothetical protein [unclassified Undibacterium]|uniref:hypothetical protein n=1 Tax=unclassified Undibacterium TaxID=2630295 RepID=UPI002AC8AF44|nr:MULTISPECIES: hypothetical protein [unclassified Undibacterium]MEB0140263.1 hypothetical protein [Undibacterium sp. CCC2.1]MEB0173323.1 hypothetical protein [Undibacterium sp. CCC1.1]MEB0177142.1 hypothetical protein [Undibacterium sp. CCC3.4]MEB0216402.1 hypothetical protein [Undibacterium sp. 5I2]WPX45543.1 hypothetical protein RHM61_10155 [Undibacterium sp. CCC3.4]